MGRAPMVMNVRTALVVTPASRIRRRLPLALALALAPTRALVLVLVQNQQRDPRHRLNCETLTACCSLKIYLTI